MKKAGRGALAVLALTLAVTGCSAGMKEESPARQGGSKLFHASSSYFEYYSFEESDEVRTVSGTICQMNDHNGVVVKIYADRDATVKVNGSMKRKSGDAELVYKASDGTELVIAGSDDEDFSTDLDITEGNGRIFFTGEEAVYDFELQIEKADGLSYT